MQPSRWAGIERHLIHIEFSLGWTHGGIDLHRVVMFLQGIADMRTSGDETRGYPIHFTNQALLHPLASYGYR